MNSFPGQGKHPGNNIPHGQGNLTRAGAAKRKDISECQTNPCSRR